MDNQPENFFAIINFYVEWETYDQARRYLRRNPNCKKEEGLFMFLNATLSLLEGNLPEALRDFDHLTQHSTLSLPALIGQLYVRQRQHPRDSLAISRLRGTVRETRDNADLEAIFYSAWLCYQVDDPDQAELLIRDSLPSANIQEQTYTLKFRVQVLQALIEMKINGPTDHAKMLLDTANKTDIPGTVEARLALVDWYLLRNDLENAQAELQDLSTTADRLLPVRIMAAKMQLLLHNWNATAVAVDKCLTLDPQALPGDLMSVVSALFWKASGDKDLGKQIVALSARIQKREPHNVTLWARYARLFSRALVGDYSVLEKCLATIQEAVTIFPNNPSVLFEYAEQFLHQKRYEEALAQFEKLALFEEYSTKGLIGRVKAYLQLGQLDEARSLLEQLRTVANLGYSETSKKVGSSVSLREEVTILEAQTIGGKGSRQLLLDLVEIRTASIMKTPRDTSFVLSVDPIYVGQLVREILPYCLSESTALSTESPLVTQTTELLKQLVKALPNSVEATILLARMLLLRQELKTAENILMSLIDSEKFGQDSEAFLVLADVFLRRKMFNKAKTSMDRAVANSFSVKDKLEFMVLQSRLLQATGQSEQAVQDLRSTVERPGVRQPSARIYYYIQDRCSVFLQLVSVLCTLRNFKEAKKTLDEAEVIFSETSQNVRVKLARAGYLSLADPNSPDIPVVLLSVDPSFEEHYSQAQEKLASYYLKIGNHKEYLAVHEKLFGQMGGKAEASVQLGNAYLKINKVDKAIETLQTGLRREPNNRILEAAMGSFYTRCHMFSNALNYYEAAVKKGNKELRMEYAKLLVKLKRLDRAEVVLHDILNDKEQGNNPQEDVTKVRAAILLSAVYETVDTEVDERIRVLKDAYSRIESLYSRSRNGNVDATSEITELYIQVLQALVEEYFAKRDPKPAVQLLRHAITALPISDSTHLLCRLSTAYLLSADVNEAYRSIREAQKLQNDHREVYLISADIAIRRKDFDHATTLYRDFLAKYPVDFLNIAEVTPWLARLGNLQVVKKHLDDISSSVPQSQHTGYSFCEGIYLRYTGNVEAATKKLQSVAQAKSQFSVIAGKALVELLCNYDLELAGSQSLPSSSLTAGQEFTKSCEYIFKSIEDLLRGSNPENGVLLNLPVLYTADQIKLQNLVDQHRVAISSEDLSPAMGYLLASAFLLLGSKDEAITLLRRFEKTPWNKRDAEYLERMWLLLADCLDITSRGDEVSQLIFRAIEYNRGTYLVNMYEGFHCGSSNHSKAAECFRRAMEVTGGRDFVSGERYVFSQLNAHRPMEAIDGLAALERSCEDMSLGMKQPGSNIILTVQMLRRRALAALALRPEESTRNIRRQSRTTAT